MMQVTGHDGYVSGCSGLEYDDDEPEALTLNFDELKRQASLALSRPCVQVKKISTGRDHEAFVLFFGPIALEPTAPNMSVARVPATAPDIPTTSLSNLRQLLGFAWTGILRMLRYSSMPDYVDYPPAIDDTSVDDTSVHIAWETPIRSEWSCIARLSRQNESIEKAMNEIETIRYVKSNTSIPVLEIYFYNLDPTNNDDLDIENKKIVLEQIAGVLAKLASLKFDRIGSLREDGLGPLIHISYASSSHGPFQSTLSYLLSFMPDLGSISREIELRLGAYLEAHKGEPYLQAPYHLIHADLDGQNMMFVDINGVPQLSGIINWEYAYIGPLYELYEYPIFIQDNDIVKEKYAENLPLRRHFARALRQQYPKGSPDWSAAKSFIQSKCYIIQGFQNLFTRIPLSRSPKSMARTARAAGCYLKGLEDGTGRFLQGRVDYELDEKLESDEEA